MNKLRVGAVALLASVSLGACTSFDPFTGERKVNNTTKGAAIGAVAGGVVGAIAGDDEAALAGAAAGALIGGGIGNYMDRQEQELRRELASTGVRVQRNGDNIRLIMPGNITFATDQSAVRPEFYATLNSVSKVLARYNKTSVLVEGHTDNVGSDQYNPQPFDPPGRVSRQLSGCPRRCGAPHSRPGLWRNPTPCGQCHRWRSPTEPPG